MNVDVKRIDGKKYADIDDLIKAINEHGVKVGSAWRVPEFKQVYDLAYCHIIDILELIKEY